MDARKLVAIVQQNQDDNYALAAKIADQQKEESAQILEDLNHPELAEIIRTQ